MKTIIKFLATVAIAILVSCSKSNDEPTPQPPATVLKYTTTTLAGTPTVSGDADGAATTAKFNTPSALVAVGNDGVVYFTDSFNHKIKRITSGMVSTIIGSTQGDVNGAGTNAKFNFPQGICLNPSGFLMVSHDHNIKSVSAPNVTTTFVGSTQGDVYGNGTVAKFSSPKGMCFDSDGNFYVLDRDNDAIKKFSPFGVAIASFSGNVISKPNGICSTGNNLYFTSTEKHIILRFTKTDIVSQNFIAGSNTYVSGDIDGNGSNAKFNFPRGICADPQGNLYVADSGNNKIKKIAPNGDVTTISGSTSGYADGVGAAAKYNNPSGVYYLNNKLYVADSGNHCIRVITIQ